MGSPEFAVPSLERLAQLVDLVGVITQPDRPAGRGKVLTPPPVKQAASRLGFPVFQPDRLRTPEAFAQLETWAPELIVVAAFGQILRQNVLDLPRYGCINVHASLLPRWRGAAPIQAALLHGDRETGVTIMKMDAGVDTGPILAQEAEMIWEEDDAATLSARLAQKGADLLAATLSGYLNGEILPKPQPAEGATYAPMLKKEDGQLDFSRSAVELANKVRAFNPWPGAYFSYQGNLLKVQKARPLRSLVLPPGSRGIAAGLPAVGCADGALALEIVQPAGKKPMPGEVFLRGARDWLEGTQLD